MGFGEGIPEVGATNNAQPSLELKAARERAIALYLQTLKPDTPVMTRNVALRLANTTALRQDATIQAALRALKDGAARNALVYADEQTWRAELQAAIQQEPLAASFKDAPLSPQFVASFRYFSDHVAPELNRDQRMDTMSCMKCHAVEGRVPSMYLEGPNGNGYWPVAKMLKNYLTLQQKINFADIETSKLLRKPLNVQTGKEDGHQGGRRYAPSERGYQIIRRWVLDMPRVMQGGGAASSSSSR
jgi:hypothetical protein